MALSAITPPASDPTCIFEHFRGSYGTELLTAAVAHFDLFTRLKDQPRSLEDLSQALGLANRPAVVLITALRAMGLIESRDGTLFASSLAIEHLVPGAAFDVGDYIGLAASSPGVMQMVELLRRNEPLDGEGSGTAFIYRNGIKSAMEASESARHLTLALAGRAKNVAPALAQAVTLANDAVVLDLGGGTGIYSFALLQKHTTSTAIIFDRPEVLKVASEMARQYGVEERVELLPGDMFADPLPVDVDVVLLSNVLHDWDVPECQQLVQRSADALGPGGSLLIHDVFLNDEMDGPLPIALYSAALFSLTEGRAYSAAEYRQWLERSGLHPKTVIPTLVHCGVLEGCKD
jgi:predicted O-methyltransferase YrrM